MFKIGTETPEQMEQIRYIGSVKSRDGKLPKG